MECLNQQNCIGYYNLLEQFRVFNFSIHFTCKLCVFLIPRVRHILNHFVRRFITTTVYRRSGITNNGRTLSTILFHHLAFDTFKGHTNLHEIFTVQGSIKCINDILILGRHELLNTCKFFLPTCKCIDIIYKASGSGFPTCKHPVNNRFRIPCFLKGFIRLLTESTIIHVFIFKTCKVYTLAY